MLSKSRVKYIQSLYHKKFRDQEAVFIAEGPKIVKEFLAFSPQLLQSIYALPKWVENHASLLNSLPPDRVQILEEQELQKISLLTTPNMVLAIVKQIPPAPYLPTTGFSVMLDDIQDPGNMGTILRTCDWFGVKQLICSNSCVDVYNPKVIQSTMGSILRVNVLYEDLETWYPANQDIPLYAAALGGQSLKQLEIPPKAILLVGNESKGVSSNLLALCREKIMIPRIGSAESLNAAVAAGILLWQFSK